MSRSSRIQSRVTEALTPLHLEIENESSQHSVPANSETHFKILVVSEAFAGLSRVERQRKIHGLLEVEFKSGLHALTIRALTPQEWTPESAENFISPACQGGSQRR